MPLTVLTVAYPFVPIGPDAVGGTEQIATAMDRAVTAAGHRSLVVACAGSHVTGTLFAVPPCPPCLTPESIAAQQARMRDAVAAALAAAPVDLVHMHGIDFADYLAPPGPPLLATYHLPVGWYPSHALTLDRDRSWTQCVSASQERDLWPHPQLLPHIPNGIPLDAFARPARRDGYALMLARICVEKGVHDALDAAEMAGVPLVIAGEISAHQAHKDYFADQVAPRLGTRACFLGPVGLARKAELLAGATCLLVPSTAPETSSLVSMEAAAAGVPVIAFRSGALPEVVEQGRTGFLVDDVPAMAAAIPQAAHIAPETCRTVAAERFCVHRMTRRTLDRYAALAR